MNRGSDPLDQVGAAADLAAMRKVRNLIERAFLIRDALEQQHSGSVVVSEMGMPVNAVMLAEAIAEARVAIDALVVDADTRLQIRLSFDEHIDSSGKRK